MTDEKERLLADLQAIAASIQDPARRQEVQRIIARLSHQEWPDEAEMMRLRVKLSDNAN